ncbi:uncharacterized protein LOC119103916 [Pollicipes pollicipes]|uniref:uncharacterized protein LOC119102517 n=1 Tax=Pollicipes pollicipes TaxID=41117 RepID=UPI00188561BD|nr:uncharacterized protein LOC119102517 [Pollicipes pollicipes]XP_037083509.1 uncharacterized protein LOC119103916 [Pollicipes pollicipes]
MARCCCCFGLRTGTILIGVIFLLVDLAALVWSVLNAVKHDFRLWPRDVLDHFTPKTLEIATWVTLAVSAFSVLCDLLLIFAAARRTRCGQICWLLWNGLLLTLLTLALLVGLGISIWLLVDKSAAEKLGIDDDIFTKLTRQITMTEEEREKQRRYLYISLIVGHVVGLIIMSIVWGWYGAVDRNQRRLRHTTVIVKTQHVHTSRL